MKTEMYELLCIGFSGFTMLEHEHKIRNEIGEIDYLKVYHLILGYFCDINIRQQKIDMNKIKQKKRKERRKNFPISQE